MPKRSAKNSISEQNKRNALVHAIHRKDVTSRMSLARELRISNSRVCDLVDEMLSGGLLVEEEQRGERRGRRGVSIRLNAAHGQFAGIDMEARRLRMVITDFAGHVLWQSKSARPATVDRRGLTDEIVDFVADGLKLAEPYCSRLLGMGLAASGVIDTRRGVILHYDLIPHAVNLPLRDILSEHFGLPCVMENNIRAMTLAEWTSGAARGLNSFVCVAVRSGVGAGIVINGQLLAGSHGFAGEAGYMVVPTSGNVSNWKHLQSAVSEVALGVDADAGGTQIPAVVARRAGELLGAQIASIAAVLDPEAIILSGQLLDPDGAIWPHVLSSFRQVALVEVADRVPILPATLGPFAAAIGVAHRCLYELFPVHRVTT